MTKVLVVGAGPVGLTMAIELLRLGVDTRIVDQNPQPSEHSKALVVWPRTLELLDRHGLAQEFVASGHRVPAMRIHAGARLVAHISLDGLPSPFPFALGLAQSETERLLLKQLTRMGGQVEREVKCSQLSQTADQVQATLESPGGTSQAEVDWLVGCDGAHSTVRKQVNLPFDGQATEAYFHLADTVLEGLEGQEGRMFWSPDGLLLFFSLGPPLYRIIVNTPGPQDVTAESIQGMVERRGPGGIRVKETRWLSHFQVQERQVASYRSGRVFVAGDAAHVHSPAGGQGMNTGMQDAVNLAWKLAFNRGPFSLLLDSYTVERHPVGRKVLDNSSRLTMMATLSNPLAQFARNTVVRSLAHRPPVQRAIQGFMSELDIQYRHSPVNGSTAGYGTKVRAGDRAPDGPTGNGRSLFERLREQPFTVLTRHLPEALQGDLRRRGRLQVVEAEARLADVYGMVSPGLMLVRPDGYVGVAAGAEVSSERLGLWLDQLGVPSA